jgi:predicted component of type VI protein secretion system
MRPNFTKIANEISSAVVRRLTNTVGGDKLNSTLASVSSDASTLRTLIRDEVESILKTHLVGLELPND